MQTKLNKVLSFLTAILLVAIVAMPTLSYATEEIGTTKTSQENVEFDVEINGGKEATLNISQKSRMDVSINVLNTGYIKEATLTVENNNYIVTGTDNQYINKIENNVITLNQINAGENASIELPIEFSKTEKVNPELFSRESTITLNAIYVNEAGKEKKIQKTYTLKVNWTKDDAEGTISQKLVRYLAYDTNKTMLSFEVVAGVKDNTIPATAEQINIQVPTINNTKPTDVIVTGDEGNHTYKDGVLTITSENKVDENNQLVWNSEKTYMVTYIYNTEASLGVLTQNATAKITTLTGAELTAEPDQKDFAVESTVGSIVEFKEEGTDTLSKGYLLSNLKKEEDKSETNYSEKYIINVGLSSITDKINVDEGESTFVNAAGKTVVSATDKILNKKILVDKDELVKLLGDEGRITVLGADGNEIGKLTSTTTEVDLGNTNKISLETSKPVTEGNITLNIDKAIVASDIGLDEDTIKSITGLKSNVTINGTMSNTIVSTKNVEKTITLTNPTSKVGISVNKDSLSTVEENKNVIISIILKTDTIDDALFENPTFHIKLPDEVKSMRVTEAQVLYDDELKAGTINGTANTIDLTVTGKQTKYASSTITEGALIRITANLTLDETAPSDTKSISVSYVNNATGETGESTQNIQIVAPSDFVTTNTVTVGDQTSTAIGDDDTTIKVDEDAKEQNVEVTQTIVNNLGEDANGVTVLGVLPAAGNKNVEGEDLKSTTTATLTSAVNVEGQDDAKVYYSTNNNEDVNSNNWTENYTTDAKSYKVTTSSALAAKKSLKISYAAKLASNLGYDQSTSETYGVYYNNESDQGLKTNLVAAKSVTLKTASSPSVTMSISPVDTNQGFAISENGTVTTGEYITYNVKVTNNGSEAVKDVNVKMSLPLNDNNELSELTFLNYVSPSENLLFYQYEEAEEAAKTIKIASLGAGESKVLSFDTKVIKQYSTPNKKYESVVNEAASSSGDNTIVDNGDNTLTVTKNTTVYDTIETTEDTNYIKPTFTVNYTGGEEQTKEFENKLQDGTLSAKITSNSPTSSFAQNDVAKYQVQIENVSSQNSQTNVELKIKVPEGLEYTENEFSDEEKQTYDTDSINKSISYDSSSRTISYKISNLEIGSDKTAIFSLKVSAPDSKEFKIQGTLTSDQEKDGVKTNQVSLNTQKSGATPEQKGFSLKQSTNLQNNTCYDTDSFKIYIELTNHSGSTQNVTLENMIPSGLSVKSKTLTLDGESIAVSQSDYLNKTFEIANGSTAKAVIDVIPYKVQKGKTANIDITSTLTLLDNGDTELKSDVLTITVNGTSEATVNPIDPNGNGSTSIDGTYIIGGKIYNDSNNNGKEDENENGISGVRIRLINAQTRETVKNADGNACETTSGSDGTYSFTRLQSGSYVAVAEYDTSLYTVGIYQSSDASEDDNNDFISQTIDGKQVAASNIISPSKNEYNIDLALVNRDTFDLRLNKIVSKITVVNPANGNKTYNYNKNNAKVELSTKNVTSNNVLIEYKIQIINEGNVAGYATSIMDKIPEGLTFNSELNTTWYTKGKNAYNQTLANTLINPGETKEVTLVLSKQMTADNMGTFNNIAEIESSYNEYSIKDIDSEAGNMQDGEDDQSNALVIIAIGTGRTIVKVGAITLAILGGIGLAVYLIRKKIIKDEKI